MDSNTTFFLKKILFIVVYWQLNSLCRVSVGAICPHVHVTLSFCQLHSVLLLYLCNEALLTLFSKI